MENHFLVIIMERADMDNHLLQKAYLETSGILNEVAKKRKSTQFFQKVMWAITGLYFLAMLFVLVAYYFPSLGYSFFEGYPSLQLYLFGGLVIILYPTTFIFGSNFQKFKLKEAEAITKMVKLLFPKVEFSQNVQAPKKEIIKSKLFAWVTTDASMYSYGQIRSSINGTVVNIADVGIVESKISNKITGTLMHIPVLNMVVVLSEYVLKNIFSNQSADNVYYTFRGMFCWLSFKKALNGHTVILTNNQSTKINRYFSSNFKAEEKINLEDPRFNNQFIVYSTDQVEARYVLSIALMERIVALKEKFNQPIILSFQNKEMFLAVENENGIFSFPSGDLSTKKIVEELANDIETALEIGSELKLND